MGGGGEWSGVDDGEWRRRRRRRDSKTAMRTARAAMTMTPPTTPPTMAPMGADFFDEALFDDDVGSPPVFPPVAADAVGVTTMVVGVPPCVTVMTPSPKAVVTTVCCVTVATAPAALVVTTVLPVTVSITELVEAIVTREVITPPAPGRVVLVVVVRVVGEVVATGVGVGDVCVVGVVVGGTAVGMLLGLIGLLTSVVLVAVLMERAGLDEIIVEMLTTSALLVGAKVLRLVPGMVVTMAVVAVLVGVSTA